MQLNNKKWFYTVAVSSLILVGNGLWLSNNNIVNAANKATKEGSTYNHASKNDNSDDRASSTSKSKKSLHNTAQTKAARFTASVYNLPKSTKGVISKVKYEKNSVDLTISDNTLNNIYDKELKRLCFNIYRKVKGDAKKAGLTLSYITIDDEQDDILANYERFGAFRYYGMGAEN